MLEELERTAGTPESAGKISAEVFDQIIKPRLGAPRADVVVGPQHGVDVGVVDIGSGQVMAVTTDPFFVMPEYGWERAAWFAVHIVASDAATSGFRPAWCTVDLNLPLSLTDAEFSHLWGAVDETCREIGVAIVGGHTGRYDGASFPILGSATMMASGPRERFVTPAMAHAGDTILLTKGAAIETTALFGVTFPDQLTALLGPRVAADASALFFQMSVVRDALAAVQVGVRTGGVTALHDATERGVYGGLCEIADASGVGMVVHRDAISIRPETRAICDYFRIDPYTASSEGTLLLTCRSHLAGAIVERLDPEGIVVVPVGEILPKERGVHLVEGGRERMLERPLVDPFWPAFSRALHEWKA